MSSQAVDSFDNGSSALEQDIDSVRRALATIDIDRNNQAVKDLVSSPSNEEYENKFRDYLNSLLAVFENGDEKRLLFAGSVTSVWSDQLNQFKNSYSATALSSDEIPPLTTLEMVIAGRTLVLDFYLRTDIIQDGGPEVQGYIGVSYDVK